MAEDRARLACYDAVSKRTPDARAASAPAAPVPAPTDPVADASIGGEAHKAAVSMIDEAWGFDPSSRRYDIRFYTANYLLFGRYTDDVNIAPFRRSSRRRACRGPQPHGGEVPVQLQGTPVDDRRPPVGRLGRVHAAEPVAALQRRPVAAVPRDELHAGAVRELPAGRRAARGLPLGPPQRRLQPPVERPHRHAVAQLGPAVRRVRRRARQSRACSRKCGTGFPESDDEDDNPDITDYLGHGELSALYRVARPQLRGLGARQRGHRQGRRPARAGRRRRSWGRCAGTCSSSRATARA